MKSLFLLLFVFLSLVQAREYKAVFDCSSGDASYVKSRMWLIGKTIDMMQSKGDTADVVLTLHGSCVPMISEDYELIVPDEDLENIKKAQDFLTKLAKEKNVKVIACQMSLNANAIDQKSVLPFVKITPNSFIDTIGYQNDGYALMTFK